MAPSPVFLPGKFHGRRVWQATDHGVTKETQLNTHKLICIPVDTFKRLCKLKEEFFYLLAQNHSYISAKTLTSLHLLRARNSAPFWSSNNAHMSTETCY